MTLPEAMLGQEWNDIRPWENDRIFIASITQEKRDSQGDLITLDAFVKAMPRFIERGVLIDSHKNKVRGRPVGWRVEGDKIVAALGVYADAPNEDEFWEAVKSCGDKCGTSIGADPIERLPGRVYTDINIYELSFLRPGIQPSNPGAWVQTVNTLAKAVSELESRLTPASAAIQEAPAQSGDVAEGPAPDLIKQKCPKCGYEMNDEEAKKSQSTAPAPQASASQQESTTMSTEEKKAGVPSEQLLADLKAGVESLSKCRAEFEAMMKAQGERIAALEKAVTAKPAEVVAKPEDALTAALTKALEPVVKRLDAIEAKAGTPGKPTLEKSAASETGADGKQLAAKNDAAALLEAIGFKGVRLA